AVARPLRWGCGRHQARGTRAAGHAPPADRGPSGVIATSAHPVAAYHDLLTDEVAAETQAQLESQLRGRGLYFGDRPLCTVVRPRLMSPAQHRALQTGVTRVARAFARAHQAAMADPALRAQFGLEPWEERLIT